MIFFLPSFLGADKKNHPKKYAMGGIWLPHLNIWRWKFSHDFFVLPAGLPTGSRHTGLRVTIKDKKDDRTKTQAQTAEDKE